MNPRAFLAFKNNSDITRTLISNNFKPKVKSGIMKRMEEVIKIHDQNKANEATIKRLSSELDEFALIDPDGAMLKRMAVKEVKNAFETGVDPFKVKEMLDKLPSSYLPTQSELKFY